VAASNSVRTYRSPLRQEQARRTRTAVLDAAGRLFVSKGYGATTMKDIAAEAAVSVESVYAQGGKAALLLACVDRAMAGDDEAVKLIDRPQLQAVLDPRADLEERLARFHALAAQRLPTSAPIFEAFRRAAAADEDLAAAWARYDRQRYEDISRIVEALAGDLRAGLSVKEATESLWALSSASMMLMFWQDRGWTPEEYADWLVDAVRRLLLE
jgi:AcrR family transcriptional regulator